MTGIRASRQFTLHCTFHKDVIYGIGTLQRVMKTTECQPQKITELVTDTE